MSGISENVIITTVSERDERDNQMFQKGVKRGEFEESSRLRSELSRITRERDEALARADLLVEEISALRLEAEKADEAWNAAIEAALEQCNWDEIRNLKRQT